MSLDPVSIFANNINNLAEGQEELKSNLVPDESIAETQIFSAEKLIISGNSRGISRLLATTSFVIDHPVYGYIDSATLAIDGDRASSIKGVEAPFVMPLTFSTGTTGTSELWNINF